MDGRRFARQGHLWLGIGCLNKYFDHVLINKDKG